MTQLVGRILRQPYAAKTRVELLDECYVICHHAQTHEVVGAIKTSLERDGMADLAVQIREHEGDDKTPTSTRRVRRRERFAKLEIFLPVVNWVNSGQIRPLDYDQDILFGLDWSSIDVATLADKIPTDDSHAVQTQMTRISLSDDEDGEFFQVAPTEILVEQNGFDPVYATRIVADLVSNAWIARDIVGKLIERLRNRGFEDAQLGPRSGFILEELRKFLNTERDRLAEELFLANVSARKIQFRLRTDRNNWQMPHELNTDLLENAAQLPKPDGTLASKSLFSPVYRVDYNKDEAEFACYLDEAKALKWWHRNVAKAGHYFVQGWKKSKVYPDFIFALVTDHKKPKLVVMEMKGDQLRGNLDTEYKRKLLKIVSDNYMFEHVVKAGELELVIENDTSVSCDLVLLGEWKTLVPNNYFIE